MATPEEHGPVVSERSRVGCGALLGRRRLLGASVLFASVVACAPRSPGAAPLRGDGPPTPSASKGASSDTTPEPKPPSLLEPVGDGWLALDVCADDIVRVAYAKDQRFFQRTTLATAPKRCSYPAFDVSLEPGAGTKTLRTAKLLVRIELESGRVTFFDREGRPILAERKRALTPVTVQGESTFEPRQEWEPNDAEALYGLGQHQQGLLNIDGVDLDLRQYNTEIFVPFLVSSRGYGVLWDNTSFTRFGDLGAAAPLPAVAAPGGAALYLQPGQAPSSPRAEERRDPVQPGDVAIASGGIDWSGTVRASATGEHLFRAYSNGEIQLWVDDRLVIDHYRQFWLPGEDIARVPLVAGRDARVRLRWKMDGQRPIVRLLWKPPVPGRSTSLWSRVGDGVDYTLVYGPTLERVVAGYRQLTGDAPMMPRWAFGLWQCRERYRTQQESLDVVAEYRRRGIPLDNIVQDWQYWKPEEWGSHGFDPSRFPDPDAWVRSLHEQHVRLMLSVWPKFYPGTANFDALKRAGFLYQRGLDERQRDFLGNIYTNYDAFEPRARELYWSQVNSALFARGVDAWWLDASEPELVDGPFASVAAHVDANETHLHPTALGTGSRMLNAFSLVNSQAVYEGQRRAAPQKRVFILTRNGFAGQQRHAAASWSGDITSSWTALRRQIPAGLGFSLSGIPYWTLDSGGFAVPGRFSRDNPAPADREEWNELNTRWFQFATFLPLLRVHGQYPHREMWEFGGDASPAFEAQLEFDRLRYRLLPYLYSLADAVTHAGSTFLRPLVMDFPDDARARTIADQYSFGPGLLISPVTAYRVRSRDVYLPKVAGGWYDFWSGKHAGEGGVTRAASPFERIPVHVRAGSIVPFGPELTHTGEKPADPLTLYVYAGADGAFTLYEDDGESYEYERGAFARIPLRWTDARRTLTLGAREGSFPGMLEARSVEIVLVTATRSVPFSFRSVAQRTLRYEGAELEVQL
jgi:alpha-D-xyloside xylohydrolase